MAGEREEVAADHGDQHAQRGEMKSKVMTGRRKRDQLILVINIDRREK